MNTTTKGSNNMNNVHLINLEITSKNNSVKNTSRVINRGIEPQKKYHIVKNLWIAFYPSKHSAGKRYYKGEREITRETFLNNLTKGGYGL